MSNAPYTDPRFEPPRHEPDRVRNLGEMNSGGAIWGWIAGGIVLVLLLVFIFGRAPNTTDTAGNVDNPPAATTGSRSPAPATMPPQRTAPSTTGQAAKP